MAAGRIMARDVLQRVADFFKVEGLKQAPAHLNLEQVLLVYDVGQSQAAADPGAGQGLLDFYVVSPPIASVAAVNYWPVLQGLETSANAFRVDSLVVEVLFPSTALLSAFVAAGGTMEFVLGLKFSNGDPGHYPVVVGKIMPVTGQLLYQWSLKGGNTTATPANAGQVTGVNHASTWGGAVPAAGDPGNGHRRGVPRPLQCRRSRTEGGQGMGGDAHGIPVDQCAARGNHPHHRRR